MKAILSTFGTTILLITAMASGAMLGVFAPSTQEPLSSFIDPLILTLVFLLFFEIHFQSFKGATKHWRFLSIAWVANFVIIPLIGWGIASLFLSGKPLLYTGLLIYFIAPCTDWFLGFTRLARGDTSLGAILLPINLVTQLILCPILLGIYVGEKIPVDGVGLLGSLWQWFLIPLLAAILFRLILSKFLTEKTFSKITKLTGKLITCSIVALVLFIFTGNIETIWEHAADFTTILLAVFCFLSLHGFFANYSLTSLNLATRSMRCLV